MNFTKDYIELAKDKRIQELKSTTSHGDWFCGEKRCPQVTKLNGTKFGDCIWLPTGDQLDEEIVRICKTVDGGGFIFDYGYRKYPNKFYKSFSVKVGIGGKEFKVEDDNPLIAKLKLLLELL